MIRSRNATFTFTTLGRAALCYQFNYRQVRAIPSPSPHEPLLRVAAGVRPLFLRPQGARALELTQPAWPHAV